MCSLAACSVCGCASHLSLSVADGVLACHHLNLRLSGFGSGYQLIAGFTCAATCVLHCHLGSLTSALQHCAPNTPPPPKFHTNWSAAAQCQAARLYGDKTISGMPLGPQFGHRTARSGTDCAMRFCAYTQGCNSAVWWPQKKRCFLYRAPASSARPNTSNWRKDLQVWYCKDGVNSNVSYDRPNFSPSPPAQSPRMSLSSGLAIPSAHECVLSTAQTKLRVQHSTRPAKQMTSSSTC